MVSSLKLVKLLFAILVGGLVFSSCSKSDQKKASDLIMDHAKTTIADYESFEIVQMDTIKEVYSDVYEEQELIDLYNSYYYYLDSINDMNQEIKYLDSYIKKTANVLMDLERKKEAAYYRYNELLLVGYSWSTYMNAKNNYDELDAESQELFSGFKNAQARKEKLEKNIKNCNEVIAMLSSRTIDFNNNYKPYYLGRGTIMKCRYKGENSNMMFATYKVIFNDDISELLSIKYVSDENYQNIKTFVNKLVN